MKYFEIRKKASRVEGEKFYYIVAIFKKYKETILVKQLPNNEKYHEIKEVKNENLKPRTLLEMPFFCFN